MKRNGNYMYHTLQQSVTLHFVFMDSVLFSQKTAIIALNSLNILMLVMVTTGILFEVRTEFLNNI
jgi:hypothetical protein